MSESPSNTTDDSTNTIEQVPIPRNIQKWIQETLLSGDTQSSFISILEGNRNIMDELSGKLAKVLFEDLHVCHDEGYLIDAIKLVMPLPGFVKRATGVYISDLDPYYNLEIRELLLAYELDGGETPPGDDLRFRP